MPAYAALLRAVNVGGTGKLAMTDLRALCAGAGFSDMKTYIQSGNVVFKSSLREAGVKKALERALAEHMGKPVAVLVRAEPELAALAELEPFPGAAPSRVGVLFLDEAPPPAGVKGVATPGGEELSVKGRHILIHFPDGMGRSKLKLPAYGDGTMRNLNTVRKLAALLAALLLALGCARPRGEPKASTAPAAPAAVATPAMRCLPPEEPLAVLHASPSPDGFPSEVCLARARELLAKMTLDEKLGQMMQPERDKVRNDDARRFAFGSILSGGGSGPTPNTPAAWAEMVREFQRQSLDTRLGIPLLYGSDAVHGHNNVKGAVIFPHNIGLGAARDPDLVTRIGRATAIEVAATGVDWTFAPVVAAARDERWGRTYEAFGETAELAALLGPALIRGLQGERLGARPDGVLACAKHFLGDGHTTGGDDQGNAVLAEGELERDVLPPYQRAIEAGVGSIMVSFSSLDGVKMHCHGPLLNDVLKGKLGFGGFLVSDWQALEQLPGDYETQIAEALTAGIDMVMAPRAYTGFIEAARKVVPARVPLERIDDAVLRILNVKCALGRLEPKAFRRTAGGGLEAPAGIQNVGSPAHRLLAREAVRKSLVLLKNENSVLPLARTLKRIHVAGSHADDIGNQTGGWTITWQGGAGATTTGTTLRQAFEAHGGASITYSLDGSGAKGADVAVAAIGEKPYAEGHGDDQKLGFDPRQIEVVSRLKAAGVPVVLVLMTGRPMILGELSELADAIVAAWLPGSEAGGITDVLFGEHDFEGKLPHSWPRSLEQVPINAGDASYDPLFAYGFGLRYGARQSAAKQ